MGERWNLAERITTAPKLADARKARARLADLLTDPQSVDSRLSDLVRLPEIRDLLLGVADHSDFLWGLARDDPTRLMRLFARDPAVALESLVKRLRVACIASSDDAEVARALRLARQEAALLIGLADIGGAWGVDEVVAALTDFADAATQLALRQALRSAAAEGRVRLDDAGDPERNCGIVVIAMGKHGARELNYSSDIDLMIFYDPAAGTIPGGRTPEIEFVRVAQAMTRLLQQRTSDGYVQRVDLRLRPDPGSTPIAISLPAAFDYYVTIGQNWERAALIKARPVAGDIGLGERFVADLAPFIWRKYFDYAAIADIHAMKRQIHAVRGHQEVAVAGHDIKLGRGGIREIEFFVQTQQLIFGGRRPALRGARTLDMLEELRRDGWITAAAARELAKSYRYLRRVEHRLQMIADQQTQRLPADDASLASFTRFLGHSRKSSFEKELTARLRDVERNYARLFENAPALHARAGNLVFTGVVDDPETLRSLAAMGFREPSRAIETVRGWHFGRRPAARGERAREALTELAPRLIEAFAGSGEPDAALAAFDEAMSRMAAAVELFSILNANADVRALFADILGGAPRLARIVEQRPHVLDAVIGPDVAGGPVDVPHYRAMFDAMAKNAADPEAFLDGARDLAREEMFVTGVRALSGAIDAPRAGQYFSALAEASLGAMLARVEAVLALEHGRVPGARCAIVGMGRLGAREMTATSDLDLILIYEYGAVEESDGRRPLHAAAYFARLTQRLISAISAPTARGKLYDVDMRLRPSGRSGPIATRLASFRDYQLGEAETWEHMALTRARVMAGDASLAREIDQAIADIMRAPRDAAKVRRDAAEMRALIERERGGRDAWDLKLVPGGFMDIDFIAQILVLANAQRLPDRAGLDASATLRGAAAMNLLDADDAAALIDARELMTTVTQLVRIAIEGRFDPSSVAAGVLRRIAGAAGFPDFAALDAALQESRQRVREAFRKFFD